MTNDSLSVVSVLFQSVFRLFTSWYIPGTNVTPAVAIFGIAFIMLSFRLVSKVLGLFGGGSE